MIAQTIRLTVLWRIIVRANGQNHAVVGGTLQLYQGAVNFDFLSCDPRLI